MPTRYDFERFIERTIKHMNKYYPAGEKKAAKIPPPPKPPVHDKKIKP